MTWAREEFRLGKPDKNGTPLRAHLQAAGIEDPNPHPFPDALAHIWEWFLDLHSARPVGMGPGPITWEGMLAWTTLTGTTPAPWEIRAIRALDSAFLASSGA